MYHREPLQNGPRLKVQEHQNVYFKIHWWEIFTESKCLVYQVSDIPVYPSSSSFISFWNAWTGSTSISDEGFGSDFPSGEDFGVILVTEISEDVIEDDEEFSKEFDGDLGPLGSILNGLDASSDVKEFWYEGGVPSRGLLIISMFPEDEDIGGDLDSWFRESPFLLLKMLS